MIYDELFRNKIDSFFKEKLKNIKWSYEALQANYGIREDDEFIYEMNGVPPRSKDKLRLNRLPKAHV